MAKPRIRKAIGSADVAALASIQPLAGVESIAGVRVFDVGQGDAIAVLAKRGGVVAPVLRLDYGGRGGNPFPLGGDIDKRMPVPPKQLLMLSHWDEDHWCSARRGTLAQGADWLVPRQITSPRAALFSATLNNVRCIPEALVGQTLRFDAPNGDYILFEKIGSFPGRFAKDEDCNRSGVALAVVSREPGGTEAILLPGDAPFGSARIFANLARSRVRLRGVVAFHHGAGTHWTRATEQLLEHWPTCDLHEVVFSCSDDNSFGHPHQDRYEDLLPDAIFHRTGEIRTAGMQYVDILF